MKDRIETVFFDLDRTLWDFDTNSKEAIHEVFVHFRIHELTGADIAEFHGIYETVNEEYWERYRYCMVTQPELRLGRFLDTLRSFGHVDSELAGAMGKMYIDICPRKTVLVDGAIDLLEHLNGRYALHVITNGFEEVQHIKLENSGLRRYFGEVVTSERAGVKKPDPGIFRFAEQLTDAVPERTLMIGDHLEADVIGASQVGWDTVHFAPDGNPSHGHRHVTSLREVMGML